jgi:hypothetical protein
MSVAEEFLDNVMIRSICTCDSWNMHHAVKNSGNISCFFAFQVLKMVTVKSTVIWTVEHVGRRDPDVSEEHVSIFSVE